VSINYFEFKLNIYNFASQGTILQGSAAADSR